MSEPVFSEVIAELMSSHFRHLRQGSGISVDVIKERGYRSLLGKAELGKMGFSPAQRQTHILIWTPDGPVLIPGKTVRTVPTVRFSFKSGGQ